MSRLIAFAFASRRVSGERVEVHESGPRDVKRLTCIRSAWETSFCTSFKAG